MKFEPNAKMKRMAKEKNWPLRSFLTLILVVAAGLFGWWWKDQVLVRQVTIEGVRHADEEMLREMIHVDSTLLFFKLEPVMIADRVRRHPWVEDAQVKRFPNGKLGINVTERVPAMLIMGENGEPDRYLDSSGFQMPFQKDAIYDVPLLSGLTEAMHPTRPVKQRALLRLLQELQHVPVDVDALISEFEIEETGEISLHTAPKPGRGSIRVVLGRDQFLEKLSKLHTFWHEAVLKKDEITFASIDLRFDSQIITKEVRLSQ